MPPTQGLAPSAPPPEPEVSGVQDALVYAIGSDFADLQQALDPLMGAPLEEAHAIPGADGCDDEQQRTSTGLAYLPCTSGVSSFVADPDGMYHWSLLGGRLAAWIGPQIDPPDLAMDPPVCIGPARDPETACPLRMNVAVAGFLREPGESDAYRFTLQDPSTDVVADLTNLSADYDLYVVDESGAVRAQSMQEGTSPEHIEQLLAAGTYYVYVHVDSGREPDPAQAYTLRLSQVASPTDEAPIGAAPYE